MVTIFGKTVEFNGIELLDSVEVSATRIPDVSNCFKHMVYRTEEEYYLKAHDLLFKTDQMQELVVQVGNFIETNAFNVMAYKVSELDSIYILRFYKTPEWPCVEHPEMFLGQPIGQYHCPYCGEMQMAGMLHLPKNSDADLEQSHSQG